MDEIVLVNMGVAAAVAAQYRGRGVSTEDLQQVAYLALVQATRHYDHSLGSDFLSYCVPTIRGEIRHYFRDHGWIVRPPRRVQELQARVFLAEQELTSTMGRMPHRAEVAAMIGATRQEVGEAVGVSGCYTPLSLDQPASGPVPTTLGDVVTEPEDEYSAVEERLALAAAIRRLRRRDRQILFLRFFHDRTQQQIAEEIGVTQMQVSRLLRLICQSLRDSLSEYEDRTRRGRLDHRLDGGDAQRSSGGAGHGFSVAASPNG